MFDFQFFEKRRIDELVALENEALNRRKELSNLIRVSRIEFDCINHNECNHSIVDL